MPAGKLSVSPFPKPSLVTIHGLDQNGFPNSHTFIGCYISQSEKQRTNSAPGPQPHFKDTLSYNVTETSETLFLDVVNEDPSHPGVIGSGQLPLKSVLDTGRFEDWVPLQSSNGGHLGHLFMKLSFSPSGAEPNPYGVSSPTSTPIPSSDTRDVSAFATSGQLAPAYNPNANISTLQTSGVPQPAYPGAASSFSPSTPVAGVPPVATDPAKKPKKEVPEWMKYGGAALAGAAAVGLGAWAVDALGSDDEEQDEEARQKAYEAQQQQSMMSGNAYDQPQEPYASRNFSGSDDAEAARREEEKLYQERRREEEELYQERRREEERALREAVEAAESAADRAEEAADEAEEHAEDAEEAAEEAEEAAEEAEEHAEDAEEAAEEAEEHAEDAEEAAEKAEEAAEDAEEAAEEAEEAAEEAEEAAEDAEEAAEDAEEAADESGSSSDEEREEERRVPNDCKWR